MVTIQTKHYIGAGAIETTIARILCENQNTEDTRHLVTDPRDPVVVNRTNVEKRIRIDLLMMGLSWNDYDDEYVELFRQAAEKRARELFPEFYQEAKQ